MFETCKRDEILLLDSKQSISFYIGEDMSVWLGLNYLWRSLLMTINIGGAHYISFILLPLNVECW